MYYKVCLETCETKGSCCYKKHILIVALVILDVLLLEFVFVGAGFYQWGVRLLHIIAPIWVLQGALV